MIANEQDGAQEIYFITDGKYDVGYTVNRKKRYRLQFGERTVIGGFAVANDYRHNYNYRAHNKFDCFVMRRNKWYALSNEFEYFTQCINYKFIMFFTNHLHKPLQSMKLNDIEKMRARSDYQQFKVLDDKGQKFTKKIFEMRLKIFQQIQLKRNFMLDEFLTIVMLE